MDELQRLNDSIYGRCTVCHEELRIIEKTSNRWLHRLVGADRLTVRRCDDDDYTRIDKVDPKGHTTWQIWHGEDARTANSRAYR